MKADYNREDSRTISSNAVMDVRELSIYSHADTVILVFITTDDIEHCVEFEIDDSFRLIDSIKTAIHHAKHFEYEEGDLN